MKLVKRPQRKFQHGWTTAEYILGLSILAVAVITIVTALSGKLQGLLDRLPF